MTTNEMRDAMVIDYLVNFYFIYFLLYVQELRDFLITNSQTDQRVVLNSYFLWAENLGLGDSVS